MSIILAYRIWSQCKLHETASKEKKREKKQKFYHNLIAGKQRQKKKKGKRAGNKQAEENNKGNAVSEMKREISEIKSYFGNKKIN